MLSPGAAHRYAYANKTPIHRLRELGAILVAARPFRAKDRSVEPTEEKNTLQETLAHWQALARHTPLAVVCDLDGTLVPFTATPIESALPPSLVALLNELAALDGVRLTIASGRLREQLQHIMAPVPEAWLMACLLYTSRCV